MRLYHLTRPENLASIRRYGLLTSRARSKAPVIWLARFYDLQSLALHLISIGHISPDDYRVIRVDAPDDQVYRHGPYWRCCRTSIPPANLKVISWRGLRRRA